MTDPVRRFPPGSITNRRSFLMKGGCGQQAPRQLAPYLLSVGGPLFGQEVTRSGKASQERGSAILGFWRPRNLETICGSNITKLEEFQEQRKYQRAWEVRY